MLHGHAHIGLWVFQLSHDKEEEQEEDLDKTNVCYVFLGPIRAVNSQHLQ